MQCVPEFIHCRWLVNSLGLWKIIAHILIALFLTSIYRVFFVAVFLLLKILLLLLPKILAWYLEILSILLAVLIAVAYRRGTNLINITNVILDL